MTETTRSLRAFVVLFLTIAISFGNLSLAGGQDNAPPASNERLSPEQGLQAAIDWAKFGKDPTPGFVVDAAISVLAIGFPPAGAGLGAAWGFIQGMGSSADPVGDALKTLSARIDQTNKRVDAMRAEIASIRDKTLQLENEIHIKDLLDRRDKVKLLTSKLLQKPPDWRVKEQIVQEAMILANRYLPDAGPDAALWIWSDQRIFTDQNGRLQAGKMLDPAFKIQPTFDYYVNTLVLLMNAIAYEVGNNTQLAVKKYGNDLLRHAQYLSVRPSWRENFDPPDTLPEWVMSRNTCYIQPSGPYPKNRVCGSYYICDDLMRRTRTYYPGPDYSVPSNNQLCTLPARPRRIVSEQQYQQLREDFEKNPSYGTSAMQLFQEWTERQRPTATEDEMEEAYGVRAMALLADKLERLAKYGSMKEQYIGQFDSTRYTFQFLYGVKPNGELVWFEHIVGVDKNPPKEPSRSLAGRFDALPSSVAGTTPAAAPSAGAGSTKQSGLPGRIDAARNVNVKDTAKLAPKVTHKWEGPKIAGAGWQTFVQIIPAGQSGLYGLGADGSLRWFRHDGYLDGTVKWKGPINAIPAAIVAQPSVSPPPPSTGTSAAATAKDAAVKTTQKSVGASAALQSRLPATAPANPGATASPEQKNVGSTGASPAANRVTVSAVNWLAFRKIVAGGDGVLYGIGADGALHWHRHQDFADALPQPKWSGPTVVGSGWQNFVQVFSTGEGIIYAVQPNGDLLWYRHRGYLTGQNVWEGPKKIGGGWAGFRRLFSPGTGVVYALQADGALLWYQHDGYQDGTVRWQGPTQVAVGWGSFVQVFPRIWGTPAAAPAIK